MERVPNNQIISSPLSKIPLQFSGNGGGFTLLNSAHRADPAKQRFNRVKVGVKERMAHSAKRIVMGSQLLLVTWNPRH